VVAAEVDLVVAGAAVDREREVGARREDVDLVVAAAAVDLDRLDAAEADDA
jgi:hypothetical protein